MPETQVPMTARDIAARESVRERANQRYGNRIGSYYLLTEVLPFFPENDEQVAERRGVREDFDRAIADALTSGDERVVQGVRALNDYARHQAAQAAVAVSSDPRLRY